MSHLSEQPIYRLKSSHTTRSGTVHDAGQWLYVHGFERGVRYLAHLQNQRKNNTDRPFIEYALVSPYNRKTGLPKLSQFTVPRDKLEKVE